MTSSSTCYCQFVGNHSCTPNAEVTFPYNNHRLVCVAMGDIQQHEVSSSRLLKVLRDTIQTILLLTACIFCLFFIYFISLFFPGDMSMLPGWVWTHEK